MHFSKNTILALAPFLVASPATAAPRGTLQERRESALVSRNPALVALEAFGLAVDLINGITEMADGGGGADGDESEPRSLGQIDDRGTQAVCISGEKQVNPVWFRTTFREMCKQVVDYGDKKPTTGKYENMVSVIEKHTAAWGQEIEFEIAWTYKNGVPESDGQSTVLTLELCEQLVNSVGDQCLPTEYDGEPQTQGAKPVIWNDEILLILDVTEP